MYKGCAVNTQLWSYLSDCSLLPSTQSAYHPNHSTETAVPKVSLDILDARGLVTLLGLLDLSAAFDTVDHSYLLDSIEITFCLNGNALTWFSSYLNVRTFLVHWNTNNSAHFDICCPISQGSLLFLTYTASVIPLIISYGFQAHVYADDVQAYRHCLLHRWGIDSKGILRLC